MVNVSSVTILIFIAQYQPTRKTVSRVKISNYPIFFLFYLFLYTKDDYSYLYSRSRSSKAGGFLVTDVGLTSQKQFLKVGLPKFWHRPSLRCQPPVPSCSSIPVTIMAVMTSTITGIPERNVT